MYLKKPYFLSVVTIQVEPYYLAKSIMLMIFSQQGKTWEH